MNVALIPARGGSKSIPYKNIKIIYGKPLIYWSIKAASECKLIDHIYVSTEDSKIKKTVEDLCFENVTVISRSFESATDEASTETVLLEFAKTNTFDNIVLIQATSPLLESIDLYNGFQKLTEYNVDSVISVVEQKKFIWEEQKDGYVRPKNYNIFERPRRQNYEGILVENGAFYITKRKCLLESKNRISGNIAAVKMNDNTYWEVDEPNDFRVIEKLLEIKNETSSYKTNTQRIKMFLTDCDGCLTDGGIYLSENGVEMKKFNAQDGKGFQLLKEKGVITGIITGEKGNLICDRAQKLNVDYLEMGVLNKKSTVINICDELNLKLDQVAYVGDDINDIELMQIVGYSCCVNNAIECVKGISDYISPYPGGSGAVRDCIEHLFSAHLV